MIKYFTTYLCYYVGKIQKKHVIVLKGFNFVVTKTEKNLACYYLW